MGKLDPYAVLRPSWKSAGTVVCFGLPGLEPGPGWTATPPEGTGLPTPTARDAIGSIPATPGLITEESCRGWRRSQTAAEGVGRPPWLPGPD